jgi:hypothetical protein
MHGRYAEHNGSSCRVRSGGFHGEPVQFEHVSVDLRGYHVLTAQQFPNGADVDAIVVKWFANEWRNV